MQRQRYSIEDTFHLIQSCPAADSLRRSLFGDFFSINDLWSRAWEFARLLGLLGFPPCPHREERRWVTKTTIVFSIVSSIEFIIAITYDFIAIVKFQKTKYTRAIAIKLCFCIKKLSILQSCSHFLINLSEKKRMPLYL